MDISFVFAEEKPAGRHGFIRRQGDGFVFADGTPARFWGTNFNGGACFPEHDYAEKLARRLAKMGLNIVRFHRMGAEWNTPNILQFAKGPVREDSRNLDFRSLDRLDYLVYCLKREGIYHGVIPSSWEDGILRFTVGEHWRSMYYLIQAE